MTQTGRQRDRQTGRQAGRQADRQAGRQAGRQADRQTDRQTETHTITPITHTPHTYTPHTSPTHPPKQHPPTHQPTQSILVNHQDMLLFVICSAIFQISGSVVDGTVAQFSDEMSIRLVKLTETKDSPIQLLRLIKLDSF